MKAHLLHQVRRLSGAAALAGAVLLAGCGTDTSPVAAVAQTLNGVAATGAPIVGGTVNITCAGGSALSTTTGTNGAWTVTLSGQTLPCAVQVSGGNLPGGTFYHSMAVSVGTVNVTPLTDLVLANAVGQSPATWFTGLNATQLQAITSQAINNALAAVRTALALPALTSVNPLTDTFSATAGNSIDDILEALATALTNAGLTYANLLTTIASNGTPSGTLQSNLLSAWQALPSASASTGGSSSGGSTPASCGSGGTLFTYSIGSGAGNPYTNGQQVCFTATSTTLQIDNITLSNPVINSAIIAPFSGSTYIDLTTGITYEVIFNSGALYEVNVLNVLAGSFLGQFM